MSEMDSQLFREGLIQQEIEADTGQIELCLRYLELLSKWNKTHNLTAVTDWNEMIRLHLLDSLSVLPLLNQLCRGRQSLKIVDVGTGAGLPGLILAIFLPQYQFDLIDAREKKISFLHYVKSQLQLNNVSYGNFFSSFLALVLSLVDKLSI